MEMFHEVLVPVVQLFLSKKIGSFVLVNARSPLTFENQAMSNGYVLAKTAVVSDVKAQKVVSEFHTYTPIKNVLPVGGTAGELIFLKAGTVENLAYFDGEEWVLIETDLLPAPDVFLAGVGSGADLVTDGVGPSLQIRGLSAGAGVVVTETSSGVVTITSTGNPTVNVRSVGGGASLVADGDGPDLSIKNIVAGNRVVLTSTPSTIVVSIPTSGFSLVPEIGATGTSLIFEGAGPDLRLKTIEGTVGNFSVTGSTPGSELVFDIITPTGGIVTLESAGTGGSTTLVNDGTSANLRIKSLVASTNVAFSGDPSATVTLDSPINFSVDSSSGTELLASDFDSSGQATLKNIVYTENNTQTTDVGGVITVKPLHMVPDSGYIPFVMQDASTKQVGWSAIYFSETAGSSLAVAVEDWPAFGTIVRVSEISATNIYYVKNFAVDLWDTMRKPVTIIFQDFGAGQNFVPVPLFHSRSDVADILTPVEGSPQPRPANIGDSVTFNTTSLSSTVPPFTGVNLNPRAFVTDYTGNFQVVIKL